MITQIKMNKQTDEYFSSIRSGMTTRSGENAPVVVVVVVVVGGGGGGGGGVVVVVVVGVVDVNVGAAAIGSPLVVVNVDVGAVIGSTFALPEAALVDKKTNQRTLNYV